MNDGKKEKKEKKEKQKDIKDTLRGLTGAISNSFSVKCSISPHQLLFPASGDGVVSDAKWLQWVRRPGGWFQCHRFRDSGRSKQVRLPRAWRAAGGWLSGCWLAAGMQPSSVPQTPR